MGNDSPVVEDANISGSSTVPPVSLIFGGLFAFGATISNALLIVKKASALSYIHGRIIYTALMHYLKNNKLDF